MRGTHAHRPAHACTHAPAGLGKANRKSLTLWLTSVTFLIKKHLGSAPTANARGPVSVSARRTSQHVGDTEIELLNISKHADGERREQASV